MRYPRATWQHLPERQPSIDVRGLIFHSIVGSASAAYGHFLRSSNLESTFICTKSGDVWQVMDSDERADANGLGNRYYASCETEDNGNPNDDPWTDAQLRALADLGCWYHEAHGVPAQRITQHGAPGFGFHVMFGAPGPWTQVRGKTCPGTVRVGQFTRELLPEIMRRCNVPTGEDDMGLTADERAALDTIRADLGATKFLVGVLFADQYQQGRGVHRRGKDAQRKVDPSSRLMLERLAKDVAALRGRVDEIDDDLPEDVVKPAANADEIADALRAVLAK